MSVHATVILFYNKPKLTLACIQSYFESLKQSEVNSDHHRLILVDNGSNLAFTRQIKESLESKNVLFAELKPNRGFSCGMNAGLNIAFEQLNASTTTLLSNDIQLSNDFYFQIMTMHNIRY